MPNDRYGLPMSTSSNTALAHFETGLDYGSWPRASARKRSLLTQMEADEGFALARAALASLQFHPHRGSRSQGKRRDRRQAVVGHLPARAAIHRRGVQVCQRPEPWQATAAVHEHLAEFPARRHDTPLGPAPLHPRLHRRRHPRLPAPVLPSDDRRGAQIR